MKQRAHEYYSPQRDGIKLDDRCAISSAQEQWSRYVRPYILRKGHMHEYMKNTAEQQYIAGARRRMCKKKVYTHFQLPVTAMLQYPLCKSV